MSGSLLMLGDAILEIDLGARKAQREADAELADRTAGLHEDMLPNATSETEAAGHRAIAVAMRSLSRQIRSGA